MANKKKKTDYTDAKALGMGAAALIGAPVAGAIPMISHISKLKDAPDFYDVPGTEKYNKPGGGMDYQKLTDDLIATGKDRNAKIKVRVGTGAAPYEAYYNPMEGTHGEIFIGEHTNKGKAKAPLILAHEYGHSPVNRLVSNRLLHKIWMAAQTPGRIMMGNPLTASIPGLMAFFGNKKDKDPNMAAKAAPWLAAGLAAPVVGEEAYASLRGLRALKKATGKSIPLRVAAKLLPPLLTYAGAGAGMALPPVLINRYYAKLREKALAEKKALPPKK
jgi:hypothetical protein